MSNTKYKIIYSLKLHIALQQQGFKSQMEMKNPYNPRLNCWVYEATPELAQAYDSLLKKEGHTK